MLIDTWQDCISKTVIVSPLLVGSAGVALHLLFVSPENSYFAALAILLTLWLLNMIQCGLMIVMELVLRADKRRVRKMLKFGLAFNAALFLAIPAIDSRWVRHIVIRANACCAEPNCDRCDVGGVVMSMGAKPRQG